MIAFLNIEKLLKFAEGRHNMNKKLWLAMRNCDDFWELAVRYPKEYMYYHQNIYEGHEFNKWYNQYLDNGGSIEWYPFISKFLAYFIRCVGNN